jgi:hypothetical protein
VIKIFVDDNDTLIICNNVQPKMIKENFDLENGIDNLVNKYQLLSLTAVSVEDSATERIIKLPLLTQKKEVLL